LRRQAGAGGMRCQYRRAELTFAAERAAGLHALSRFSRFRAGLHTSQNLIPQADRSREVWPRAGFPRSVAERLLLLTPFPHILGHDHRDCHHRDCHRVIMAVGLTPAAQS